MNIILDKFNEYRIEVGETQKLKIMVLTGSAEIKGQELLLEKWYTFNNIKTFLFTYHGCTLKIEGDSELQYKSFNSNVLSVFDLMKLSGPILVIGKGRTTLCTTLINYYIRLHKKVLFTEIDLKKGNIFPGSLSTIHIDSLITYDEHIKLKNVLSFFYGNLHINNKDLYFKLINNLQDAISKKQCDDLHIVLAPDETNEYYNEICKIFKVKQIVVVGDERKYNLINTPIEKFFVPLTGFIYEFNINKSINRYFNGANGEFSYHSFCVKRKWNIVRIGEECLAPESALPLGSTRKLDTLAVNEVDLKDNSIIGISEAKTEEDILTSPVLGYCIVKNAELFKLMCCQPKLPKYSFFIQGDLLYNDI